MVTLDAVQTCVYTVSSARHAFTHGEHEKLIFVRQNGSFKPYFDVKVTAQIAPVLCKAFQLLTLFRLAIARPPLKGIVRTFVQWLLLCALALFRHLSGGIQCIITVHPIKAHLWLIYPVSHSWQGIYYPHERRLNGAQDKCTQVAMSGIVPTPKRGRSTCLSFQSSHLFGNLATAYSGVSSTGGFAVALGTHSLYHNAFFVQNAICWN